MLVRITYDQIDARHRGNLLGGALRVTSSDDDLCSRILAVSAAYRRARILVSRRRNGASVEDNDFGSFSGIRASQATVAELALERGSISLGRTASEVLHIEGRHSVIIWATKM